MNREETLARFKQAQKEGIHIWNDWANEMLEERKRLEEAGEWEVKRDVYKPLLPQNKKTTDWLNKTLADFSTREFPNYFEGNHDFSNLIFPGETQFHSCTFTGKTWFNNTSFCGDALFHSVTFNGESQFINSTFKEYASFNNSKFFKETWFDRSTFFLEAFFMTAHFKGYSTFLETIFHNTADFAAINSESAFNLEGATFEKEVPNFIQANFKEAPRLDNIDIEDDVSPGSFKNSITTFIHPDIKARYQALKRLAIQAHDHENEQRFWAGELRSDRSLRNEDRSWNRRPLVSAFWWGNIAYGCFSDYGYSIVKPLFSLFVLLCLMTNIHLFAHNSNKDNQVSELRTKTHITKQSDLKDCDIRSSAFRVAAKNGAIGLLQNPAKRSIFERDYACLYGTYNDKKAPKIPNSIFWIEILHTLFSAILIFLALLGIRNNFKMK